MCLQLNTFRKVSPFNTHYTIHTMHTINTCIILDKPGYLYIFIHVHYMIFFQLKDDDNQVRRSKDKDIIKLINQLETRLQFFWGKPSVSTVKVNDYT